MTVSLALEIDVKSIVGSEWNTKIETALMRAVNKTADRARTRAAKLVLDQVAFPASYLAPSHGRLSVASKATKDNPFEAIISGRDQATSLARFTKQKPVTGGKQHRGGKIGVTVKPCQKKFIERAFLINLKNNNIGLAVRTDGSAPSNAFKPKEIFPNVWLLYGPSVDQVLSAATDGDGVYEQIGPEMLEFLNEEFNRQVDLLDAL